MTGNLDMLIAITGATGFIGRKLVMKHLSQGDQVRVLSRRSPGESGLPDHVEWHCGDLVRNEYDLQLFIDQADVLYHCAGEIRDVTRMATLHVDGTHKLVAAATGRIGRWVQLSSVGVYGQPRDGTVTERNLLRPAGSYETTKKYSDDLVSKAGISGAFEWTILRPSIVFGEGMPNQSLFQMISAIDRGLFFFIGKPGASANYIHVDNVVHALNLCALLPQATGKILNLSDYATLESFAEMIAEALGRNSPRVRLPVRIARLISRVGTTLTKHFPLTESRIDAMTTRVIYPTDAIQEILGYRHEITLQSGVTHLVQNWRKIPR